MNEENKKKAGWKRKFVRELTKYHISYLHYRVAVVEALVLAKVILVGDAFRLGRGLEAKPLIIPTLHKTVVFSVPRIPGVDHFERTDKQPTGSKQTNYETKIQ
ncbi:MAG: conserved rane protein of unknown function [Pedosphaera sp.]|nr:conserved rane protein of unknown function [Pedosphaera sp.]